MKIGTYNYGTHETFDAHGVLLGKFSDHSAAREAMHTARLPEKFWFSEPIPSILFLQQLNDWVIEQNEKRLPKWKFKFASDWAVQIQSKLTRKHAILLECVAIQTENVTAKHFTEPKSLHGSAHWKLTFLLFHDEQDTAWQFKAKSAGRGRDCPASELIELRQRTIDALYPDRWSISPPR